MKFNVLTLFPEMMRASLSEGVVGQSIAHGEVKLETINPRQFAQGDYARVDDRPFGGGDGMVMTIDPLVAALESLGENRGSVAFLCPQGEIWSDSKAREWATRKEPQTLICGRYAGIDQRFINAFVDEQISIGNYILSGGELAAAVVIDSVVRFLPGVLGNADSPHKESFAEDVLEGPLFTRPREHKLGSVPEVLLSGDHQLIQRWREALGRVLTGLRRPQMLKASDRVKLRQDVKEMLRLEDADLQSLGLSTQTLKDFEASL